MSRLVGLEVMSSTPGLREFVIRMESSTPLSKPVSGASTTGTIFWSFLSTFTEISSVLGLSPALTLAGAFGRDRRHSSGEHSLTTYVSPSPT